MNFLISIIAAILLVALGRNFIKKHANICYIITAILSISLVVGSFTGTLYNLPSWFTLTILPFLIKSTFATSLFVIVMYTGAFKNGSKLIKYLMPIRAELSIIASMLTLAHNITFGRYHFVNLFTSIDTMSVYMIHAAVISLMMIAIMIPLFVTSFPKVRKKMAPKKWKRLQKLAYLFYGLTYLHVMFIMIPVAKSGDMTYIINVLVYSVIYLTYAAMRLMKHFNKKSFSKYIVASPAIVSILGLVLVSSLVFANPAEVVEDRESVVEGVSEEVGEDDTDHEEVVDELENEDDNSTTVTTSSSTSTSSSSTVSSSTSSSNSSSNNGSSSSNSSSSNSGSSSSNSNSSNSGSSSSNSSSSNSGSSSSNSSSSNSGSSSSNSTSSNSGSSSSNSNSSNSGSSSNNNGSTSNDSSSSESTSGSSSSEGSSSNDAVSGATQHSAE